MTSAITGLLREQYFQQHKQHNTYWRTSPSLPPSAHLSHLVTARLYTHTLVLWPVHVVVRPTAYMRFSPRRTPPGSHLCVGLSLRFYAIKITNNTIPVLFCLSCSNLSVKSIHPSFVSVVGHAVANGCCPRVLVSRTIRAQTEYICMYCITFRNKTLVSVSNYPWTDTPSRTSYSNPLNGDTSPLTAWWRDSGRQRVKAEIILIITTHSFIKHSW